MNKIVRDVKPGLVMRKNIIFDARLSYEDKEKNLPYLYITQQTGNKNMEIQPNNSTHTTGNIPTFVIADSDEEVTFVGEYNSGINLKMVQERVGLTPLENACPKKGLDEELKEEAEEKVEYICLDSSRNGSSGSSSSVVSPTQNTDEKQRNDEFQIAKQCICLDSSSEGSGSSSSSNASPRNIVADSREPRRNPARNARNRKYKKKCSDYMTEEDLKALIESEDESAAETVSRTILLLSELSP